MKKTALCALALIAVIEPAAARHDRDGVTVFRDVHFGGRYETFYGDVPDLSKTYLGNDQATSIIVPPNCRATLYREGHFRGYPIEIGGDVANLALTPIGNDHLSSLRVDCRYQSRRSERRERYDPRWSNQSPEHSSCRDHSRGSGGVTVFAGGNFTGRSEFFRFGDHDLRDNFVDQDTISSIHVSPGCTAIVFEHTGYSGRSSVITSDVPNMRYVAPGNDRISSLEVECY